MNKIYQFILTKASYSLKRTEIYFIKVDKINIGKIAISLLCAICIMQSLSAQQTDNQNKIHPEFQRIIARENAINNKITSADIDTSIIHFPSHHKLSPTNGFEFRGAKTEQRYNCIVYTKNPKALLDSGIIINSILPNFVTAWATTKQIVQMSRMQDVQYIDAPKTRKLHNDIARGNSGASLLGAGALNNTKYTGKGVIVGIYDTGLDWDHLDFRDPNDTTKSRVIKIWDQTLTAGTGEAPPTGFTYGVEYTQSQIDNELNGTPANFVREKDVFGHGTHVTGTATGNGASLPTKKYMGMAPEADIVVIKGGDGSFTSDNIVDGITYLKNLSTALGEPAVLNMSLGGEFSAHDGTDPEEVAVDDFTGSAPGRVVSISAGNDNGTNIHKQLSLAGSGTNSLTIAVPSTTTATDLFEILTYTNSSSAVSVTVTAPNGNTVTAAADHSVSVNVLGNRFKVLIDNLVDPANNNRYFDVYVERNGTNTRNPQGNWKISFSNGTTANLTLNGWLAYINIDIPTTALTGGDNSYLVGTPGNATSAITVGAYNGKLDWFSTSTTAPGAYAYVSPEEQDSMATFSSQGPRRDGVLKPDISAQGEAMVSCLSPDAGLDPGDPSVVVQGLYFVDQGTSMSSPVVTGCAALLLQVDPTATAATIKSSITSTANSDTLTTIAGTMPNTTWGYGRVDVFKAASTLFSNCTPAARKTYQYDKSYTSDQDTGLSLTTNRIAVRFTPDITGRLGGVFFQTSTTIQNLAVEVRTNNAGVPGTLLGTLNIPVADISKFSFNYFDLSTLSIPVTSGTDYFIVIYNSSGSGTWSIRRDAAVDGRSMVSTNGGSTWTIATVDYRIRPVVYSIAQLTGNIATTSSSDTRDINTSNQFYNSNCELIATVVPTGISPLTGTTTAKVTIDAAPFQHQITYFAQRHYDIEPATNAANAAATATLYFTQAEFNNYNSTIGHGLDLPTSPTDVVGISNINIAQFHGTGIPGNIPSYTGSSLLIDPADSNIVWNAANQRWETTFNVTGFSGFYLQSKPLVVLPVTLGSFTVQKQGSQSLLQWKTLQEINTSQFIIERSTDDITFQSIGNVLAAGNTATGKNYQFTDVAPLQGINYYRFKLIDKDGNIYSQIRTLTFDNINSQISISPNPAKDVLTVTVSGNSKALQLRLLNSQGQLIKLYNMASQSVQLQLPNLASGVYYLQINGETIASTNKLVIDNN